ncbi:MAG: RNA methyltransferase, partial [Candidatus Aminicenantes bacterium]|nr:RNA methyltransferase [Candidatus Aminicenantes bacterium]
DVAVAVADLEFVFAATAKPRKNIGLIPLEEAVARIRNLPPGTRLGLLFGNERTGLTADEILHANAAFTIPQSGRQPSYNLASAVLLTLFALFTDRGPAVSAPGERPLPRREQEEAINLILDKLASKGFIHGTNRAHVTALVHDLLGRLAMTDKDRRLLLAIFTKGVDEKRIPDEGEGHGRQ